MRSLLFILTIIFCCSQPSFAQTAAGKQIPDPIVQYGDITGKSASVEELLVKPELVIIVPTQPQATTSFRVISFTVSVLHNGIYKELAVRAPNVPTRDTVMVEDPITGKITMQITENNNTNPGYITMGNRLPPHQLNLLSQLKPGDRVFFDNIRAAGPDSSIRQLETFALLIR